MASHYIWHKSHIWPTKVSMIWLLPLCLVLGLAHSSPPARLLAIPLKHWACSNLRVLTLVVPLARNTLPDLSHDSLPHNKRSLREALLFFLKIDWLIDWLLCWVFVSVLGLSLVAASGGHSSSRCAGLSLSRPERPFLTTLSKGAHPVPHQHSITFTLFYLLCITYQYMNLFSFICLLVDSLPSLIPPNWNVLSSRTFTYLTVSCCCSLRVQQKTWQIGALKMYLLGERM